MTDAPRKDHSHVARPGQDALSAVRLSQELTAEIDAWAEARQMARSDAIRDLLELGLKASPASVTPGQMLGAPAEIEDSAVKQIDRLLDPALPADERERRIRRLIEGPPEFSSERIDLPKHSR